MSFNFSVPTNALFGAGKLNELHTQINSPMGAVHGKKALVVISNGKSTRANGYLDRLENELKQSMSFLIKLVLIRRNQWWKKADVLQKKMVATSLWRI